MAEEPPVGLVEEPGQLFLARLPGRHRDFIGLAGIAHVQEIFSVDGIRGHALLAQFLHAPVPELPERFADGVGRGFV